MKSTSGFVGRRQLIVTAIAVMIAAVAAPFGTGALSLPARLLFWGVLIGINVVKWALWYRHVAPRAGPGWQATALMVVAGAIILNLTLPFEVTLAFRIVGMAVTIPWAANFAAAMVVSLGVGAGIAMARGERGAVAASVVPDVSAPLAPESGLAQRAGLSDLGLVESVVAEDHYLRLNLADGRAPLVLYRFGDAVRELAAIDGLQVHRGAWVAAAAVRGAVREGRRWRLQMASGVVVPVSETFLPAVRARGWLARERA